MNLDAYLKLLANDVSAPVDVAEVALLLARDEYPLLDVEAYLCELNALAHEARRYVRGNLASRTHGLCRYLFHEMGFRGNVQNYYDPRNSYLNQVLDRRTGIPITLSVVTLAVAGRAGLPVVGVGLPGHFIVKAVTANEEVLFDPFHGGMVLTPEGCSHLVERATGTPFQASAEQLSATPPGDIVVRMLSNLKNIYLKDGDYARAVRIVERLLQLQPHDPRQRRDLGLCLLQAGQPGPAIDHLSAYLDVAGDEGDVPVVEKMLQQAQCEVARWN
ncbi:MAG: SirB1 family protein [Gemmataceae bacterium]